MSAKRRKADLTRWLSAGEPGGHEQRCLPPQSADFEGFIVWSYTKNLYLGQILDESTGQPADTFVPESIFSLQFNTFDEASERASNLDAPAVVLFAAEFNGEVLVIG
ncbi:hypothetical protein PTE30175_04470 [Pandoraea terrae]|uniref:Uncharacterized protein n=1 Tax=Pandoraea terrae TaxID=1537710 RepID=A0A5E4YK99_9BURK|nr:hypothetical protein [Pandoraea terrae]VVE48967.1 hypothetical protein PTE30175_04470 [Pandoraea terrae]